MAAALAEFEIHLLTAALMLDVVMLVSNIEGGSDGTSVGAGVGSTDSDGVGVRAGVGAKEGAGVGRM